MHPDYERLKIHKFKQYIKAIHIKNNQEINKKVEGKQ